MPDLRRIIWKGIRNHHSATIINVAIAAKNGDEEIEKQSPEVEAMIKDWREVTGKRGKESRVRLDESRKSRKWDEGLMSDEELGRINIALDETSGVEGVLDEDSDKKDQGDGAWFNKYKHHQYVRRWGLFSDQDGLDEEWFIANPVVNSEDDLDYLYNMCRHINFNTLLSRRGLPGNQRPSQETSIHLTGIANVMDEQSNCSFCRLLRRKIYDGEIMLGVPADEYDFISFQLNVVDDGPEYALRLEIKCLDVGDDKRTARFVVQKMDEGSQQPLTGRVVQQNAADISRLKIWLGTCEDCHDDAAVSAGHQHLIKPPVESLRVIDVTNNCICKIPTEPFLKYACLSYVWGTGSQIQYTTTTKSLLETPGGLADAAVDLPQTIRDAIEVTREVGLRYLWIDALCIMQDDEQDKASIIARMNSIYGNANFAIMASTNSNPTEGLPGVSKPRSTAQIVERVQGMMLSVALHDTRGRHAEIEDSRWNSRGWTFQERLLSRRSVYFTSTQMCFVCSHGSAFEDTVEVLELGYKPTTFNDQTRLDSRLYDLWTYIWADPTQSQYINKGFKTEDGVMVMVGEDSLEHSTPLYRYEAVPSIEALGAPLIEGSTLWDKYTQAVSAYTKRRMTWQIDAVNAFVGIADLLRQGVNTTFWYGMPEFALVQSLLWQPKEPLTRRVSHDGGKALFPSWTWAAWQGHISYRTRGWHNAVGFGPASIVQWHREGTVEEFLEDLKFSEEKVPQEVIEKYTQQLRSATLRLLKPHYANVLHLDYQTRGWTVERDEERNQHIFVHEAYPGARLSSPIFLPDEDLINLPSKDGSLYFKTHVVPGRFSDMLQTESVRVPIEDEFLQIGLNDEERSANQRPPWQRIVYHQGYRAGLINLNVTLEDLDAPSTREESGKEDKNNQDTEFLRIVAISRDSLPHIAPPKIGWDMYWSGDPQMMQEMVFRDEWLWDRNPPPEPDEDADPDKTRFSETGNPGWDEGRFGGVGIYKVYNVLLLRKSIERHFERVGSGKMSYCAFHAAKPKVELVHLR